MSPGRELDPLLRSYQERVLPMNYPGKNSYCIMYFLWCEGFSSSSATTKVSRYGSYGGDSMAVSVETLAALAEQGGADPKIDEVLFKARQTGVPKRTQVSEQINPMSTQEAGSTGVQPKVTRGK